MIHQEQMRIDVPIAARATRQLPELTEPEEEYEEESGPRITRTLPFLPAKEKITAVLHTNQVVSDYPVPPLARHSSWLRILLISVCVGTAFLGILTWSAMSQRPSDANVVGFFGGQSYNIQVGGDKLANTWQKTQVAPPKATIPVPAGAYSVQGPPTISADFINKVLASYGSPAAGKGQKLYDLGVKYGIDPAFALAFFMHESTFGTRGEAATTMSLGNLRCIPNRPCVDQDRGGYAQMNSWEDGFEIWYQLIRNLYIPAWGATTIEKIIPHYAPSSDNNNELEYIASLKASINSWRAGIVRV
jgi:hypothetical protein